VSESRGVPPERREALIHQKVPLQVTTAVTVVSEIKEKKRKDARKRNALCHMFKLGNPFISHRKLKMGK